MIMSQTHIFNFFPGTIHSNRILKTPSLFAIRQKQTYLPNQQVWLNKLYFQISNSNTKAQPKTKLFNRDKTFTISTRSKQNNSTYLHWLNKNGRKIKGRFLRQELLALKDQFVE